MVDEGGNIFLIDFEQASANGDKLGMCRMFPVLLRALLAVEQRNKSRTHR